MTANSDNPWYYDDDNPPKNTPPIRSMIGVCVVCKSVKSLYLGPNSRCHQCIPCSNCGTPVTTKTPFRIPLPSSIRKGYIPTWVPWKCTCLRLERASRDDTETLFYLIMNQEIDPVELYEYAASDDVAFDITQIVTVFGDWDKRSKTALTVLSKPVFRRDITRQNEIVQELMDIIFHTNLKPAKT